MLQHPATEAFIDDASLSPAAAMVAHKPLITGLDNAPKMYMKGIAE
jgi:hypothetical protein